MSQYVVDVPITVIMVTREEGVFVIRSRDPDVMTEGTSLPEALRALAEAIEIVEEDAG